MDNIEVLISESEIKKRINALAKKINKDYNGEELFVICILKGAVLFTCDLIKKLNMPVTLDFMIASSYDDKTQSSGVVKIIKDLDYSIEGKNILLVDDIIDTGITLEKTVELLKVRNPKSIRLCTLCSKKERREKLVNVDYIGFEIPNKFIVGYGLDYNQKYRQLPYIGVIK